MQNHNIRKTEKLKRFTSIPYVQGVSEPISRILTQVGIGVALKPHHTLSSLFCKPKDALYFMLYSLYVTSTVFWRSSPVTKGSETLNLKNKLSKERIDLVEILILAFQDRDS